MKGGNKMRWIMFMLIVFMPTIVESSDLQELAKQGYAVVEETHVDGEFNGCDFDKPIPLTNRLVFVCRTYSYSYSYRPKVLILKHIRNGDIKVLINDREYSGQLYKR
jgi:hypothetical protein